MGDKGEKRDNVTPIRQSEEASGRHVACPDQLYCITDDNMPVNMMMKMNPSPIRSELRTR